MRVLCSVICFCFLVFSLPALAAPVDSVDDVPRIEIVEEGGSEDVSGSPVDSAPVPEEVAPDNVDGEIVAPESSVEPDSDSAPEEVNPDDVEGEIVPPVLAPSDPVPVPPADSDSGAMAALSEDIAALGNEVSIMQSMLAESEQFAARPVPSDAPVGGYYMAVETSLGSGELYVPYEYSHGCFAYDGGGCVISLANASINALLVVGGQTYDVRFQLFSRPDYRHTSGSGWDWSTLDIVEVTGGNVQVFSSQNDVMPWVSDDTSAMLIVALLGVLVCKVFMSK